jgi:transcriptional regulator with XRE-family HTH domain
MNLKRSIKVAIAGRDWNQQLLADHSGVSASHISIICKNNTASIRTIKALATALDMTTSEFIAIGEE